MERITFDESVNRYGDCLIELFRNAFEKNNKNYSATISELRKNILFPDINVFSVFEKYEIKNPIQLIQFITSKYFEINYYRRFINLISDKAGSNRKSFVDSFEEGLKEGNTSIFINPTSIMNMINDTLYYLCETNNLYKRSIVELIISSGFNKVFYSMNPNLFLEHMQILGYEFTEKDFLVSAIQEVATNIFDKSLFEFDSYPTASSNYEFAKETAFSTEVIDNFRKIAFECFNVRTDIENNSIYKPLMCELAYNGLNIKSQMTSLSTSERELLSSIKKCNKTEKDLKHYYDQNSERIFGFFIKNINHLDMLKEMGLCEDNIEFKKALGRTLKKDNKNDNQ